MLICILGLSVIACSLAWSYDLDVNEYNEVNSQCDLSRVRTSTPGRRANVIDNAEYPMILGGLMNDWSASWLWTKDYLTATYGDELIRTGTESSIVYSGGVAEKRIPLREFIASLSSNATPVSDRLFIFDTTVTRTNPQWLMEAPIPSLFSSWDNTESESSGQVWHMLSLGASRAGLPRHYHGQTWLGLVHGMKRWFIYPPGYNPPPSVEGRFNPLLPVSEWVREVYPQLSTLPKPPLYRIDREGNSTYTVAAAAAGYRPLECIQREGEVMYLPKGWSHITLNVGETVAFGGQQKSTDDISLSFRLLEENRSSYDAMRDIGLARSNAANTLKRRLQDLHGTSVIRLHTKADLRALLAETRDTWLVLLNATTDGSREGSGWTDRLNHLQKRLHGMVNVAVVEGVTSTAVCTGASDAAADTCETVVSLKLYRGLKSAQARDPTSVTTELEVDTEGVSYEGDLFDIKQMEQWVTESVHKLDLNYGSIATLPSAAQLLFSEGIRYLRMALSVKYHPETYNLLCEVIAETDDQTSLSECISRAMTICDSMVGDERVSRMALSSIYHRLSRIYLSKRLFYAVVPLLQRSLHMNPYNAAALRDQVIVYLNLGDRPMAAQSLHVMESNVSDCALMIEDYELLKNAVLKM